jgi:hypothetical protein
MVDAPEMKTPKHHGGRPAFSEFRRKAALKNQCTMRLQAIWW